MRSPAPSTPAPKNIVRLRGSLDDLLGYLDLLPPQSITSTVGRRGGAATWLVS